MRTYAKSATTWNRESLAELPVEGGFRLRGMESTRLDTFVDAAFAFVLTLLVISFDNIPANYTEMMATVRGIPGFLASFIVLMIFWLSHRSWSRRFGLENKITLAISLSVIFTILVYVYPLRMVFETAFAYLSDGFFSSTFTITTFTELRGMFIYYSAGFLVMSLLFAALYLVTLQSQEILALDVNEKWETRNEARGWGVCALVAIISIFIANFIPDPYVGFAGWLYALTYPAIVIANRIANSRQFESATLDQAKD